VRFPNGVVGKETMAFRLEVLCFERGL
jgi:hypothetical protein